MIPAQAIKEAFTVNRPHIAEQFSAKLLEPIADQLVEEHEAGDQEHVEAADEDKKLLISKSHLLDCINFLSNQVMIREKQNFEK